MINRFKFRFYAVNYKTYVDATIESFIGSDMIPIYKNGNFLTMEKTTDVIPEQCTSLKDKNGKLIYENDYIRVINQDTKDKPDCQTGRIWVDELNCWWIKFKNEELSWNDFCSLIDYDLTLEIEVIGNIHTENYND